VAAPGQLLIRMEAGFGASYAKSASIAGLAGKPASLNPCRGSLSKLKPRSMHSQTHVAHCIGET
jgi:hypothetical protein